MEDLTALVKEKIKQKYKSTRNFSMIADIPYTTVLSALEKGIGGTAVETVIKMCDLLEIDISLWQKNNKKITPSEESVSKTNTFTSHEQKIINAYREQPDMQKSVDRLLGVEPEHDADKKVFGDMTAKEDFKHTIEKSTEIFNAIENTKVKS